MVWGVLVMGNNHSDIPTWLRWDGEPPKLNLLNASRKEMYETLALFHNHVKYVIYIMITMPTIILAIIRLWPATELDLLVYAVASVILMLACPICIISILVIHKYYQVYVSALIFATRTHIALGYKHPWFERTIKQAKDWKVKNSMEFLSKRAKSWRDTFILYSCIISVLAISSVACGIIVLYFGLLS